MSESPHVALARAAIETYVNEHRTIDVPNDLPDELHGASAGVFVCVKYQGELRGCIGTIEPTQGSIAKEIINNAICAATQDPRFLPAEPWELKDFSYTVDVLTPPELVSDIRELDPKRYGVIVESGARRGLLLPDLEGVDTVEEQLSIVRRKALIGCDEPMKLSRFEVLRYH